MTYQDPYKTNFSIAIYQRESFKNAINTINALTIPSYGLQHQVRVLSNDWLGMGLTRSRLEFTVRDFGSGDYTWCTFTVSKESKETHSSFLMSTKYIFYIDCILDIYMSVLISH